MSLSSKWNRTLSTVRLWNGIILNEGRLAGAVGSDDAAVLLRPACQ